MFWVRRVLRMLGLDGVLRLLRFVAHLATHLFVGEESPMSTARYLPLDSYDNRALADKNQFFGKLGENWRLEAHHP